MRCLKNPIPPPGPQEEIESGAHHTLFPFWGNNKRFLPFSLSFSITSSPYHLVRCKSACIFFFLLILLLWNHLFYKMNCGGNRQTFRKQRNELSYENASVIKTVIFLYTGAICERMWWEFPQTISLFNPRAQIKRSIQMGINCTSLTIPPHRRNAHIIVRLALI